MLRKILVPVDFSECSEAALTHAAIFARRFAAAVVLLHVWEPPRYLVPDALVQVPGEPSQPVLEFARQQAGDALDRCVGRLEAERCSATARLEIGEPTDTIVDVAKEEGADLIVIGTHGRTGLSHLLLGSVAERVVRYAPCPVLTLRHNPDDA